MPIKGISILATLLLAGCASDGGTASSGQGGVSPVGVVGTPFLVLLKIPVCIATAVLGAPVAAAAAIAHHPEAERGISDGIANNCGPPYTIGSTDP